MFNFNIILIIIWQYIVHQFILFSEKQIANLTCTVFYFNTFSHYTSLLILFDIYFIIKKKFMSMKKHLLFNKHFRLLKFIDSLKQY